MAACQDARGALLREEAVLHREHAWGGAGQGVDPCVVEVAAEELGSSLRWATAAATRSTQSQDR
jgi:hypothetical protein